MGVRVKAGGEEFEASVADDVFSHFMGLRFQDSGKMLFEFESGSRGALDMAFVPRPLHLYFMDEDREVFEVGRAEPWTPDPRTWSFYRPEREFHYLLESFEKLDVEEGDRLEFEI
ncbi:MAG: DUF192 domain-containing protein [Candidatus Nanohaloarchaea archaeon]